MAGGGAAGGGQRRPVHLLGAIPWGICPEGRGEGVAGDGERGCGGGSGKSGARGRVEEDCGGGAHTGHQSGGGCGHSADMEKGLSKSHPIRSSAIEPDLLYDSINCFLFISIICCKLILIGYSRI